jgi:PIN domain nuclease of toxin-antitoxin system
MNGLLDTQVVLWWLADDPKLPRLYRDAIADGRSVCYVSAASIWEISIKAALGKVVVPEGYMAQLQKQGFVELAITWEHSRAMQALPLIHRDPFDRLLVAQAMVDKLILLSADKHVRKYDVKVL